MEEMETGEREPLLKRDSSSSGVGGASASAISLETEVGGASAAAAAKAFGGGHPGDTINFGGLLPGMQASGGYIPHQVRTLTDGDTNPLVMILSEWDESESMTHWVFRGKSMSENPLVDDTYYYTLLHCHIFKVYS